jgi:hypothetical protein
MADENRTSRGEDESFWRAHHEAWKRSDLNQRQYCEAEGLPLKAFGNWRAKFKAEPQSPERKLFAGSDGADRGATVCSLITTAKLNDVERFAYLKDILERMSTGHPASRLDDRLPWNWRPPRLLN